MIVIECSMMMTETEWSHVHEIFCKQAKTGVIILPCGFKLVNEIPPDDEIVVTTEKKEA